MQFILYEIGASQIICKGTWISERKKYISAVISQQTSKRVLQLSWNPTTRVELNTIVS